MKHLIQDKPSNCGHTCIAMVTGENVRTIEKIHGRDNGIFLEDIIDISKQLNIPIDDYWYDQSKLWLYPLNCFVFVKIAHEIYPDDIPTKYHLIVRKNGKFYDPLGKTYYKLPKRYKLKSFLEIEQEYNIPYMIMSICNYFQTTKILFS